MPSFPAFAAVLALLSGGAAAQPAPPAPSVTLAEQAAKRFPQPVKVGDLIGRDVLQPIEAQPVLGRVAALVRRADGSVDMIVQLGGLFGIGGRPIAVPVDAVALLGEHVAIVGWTAAQLQSLPTITPLPSSLPPADIIRVGLVRPFH